MIQQHSGSCLCKTVQYSVQGPFESFFLCHCQHCQKDTGSAHAANLFSTTAKLGWVTGQEKIKNYTLPDTRHSKSFCSECGSPVPSLQMSDALLVVPAGSLNTPVPIRPTAHIFYSSKASWDGDLENITTFEKLPS